MNRRRKCWFINFRLTPLQPLMKNCSEEFVIYSMVFPSMWRIHHGIIPYVLNFLSHKLFQNIDEGYFKFIFDSDEKGKRINVLLNHCNFTCNCKHSPQARRPLELWKEIGVLSVFYHGKIQFHRRNGRGLKYEKDEWVSEFRILLREYGLGC